jgi:hypothetical protein
MLRHNIAYAVKVFCPANILAFGGMVFRLVQACGFSNIVQQGTGYYRINGQMETAHCETLREKSSYAGDDNRMLPDIRQHPVRIHYPETFFH